MIVLFLILLERICDSAIANVFIVEGNNIYTPLLAEGCVAGVMRRWMLEKFKLAKFKASEKNLSIEDLLNADEIFLTNSVYYMRWVKNFREKSYGNTKVKEIYNLYCSNHLIESLLFMVCC